MTLNQTLQLTIDPAGVPAVAKTPSASTAAELRRYVLASTKEKQLMLMKLFSAIFFLLLLGGCVRSETGVMYDISISKNGDLISSPTFVVEFGEEATFDIGGEVRLVLKSLEPSGSLSEVSAQIYFPMKGELEPEQIFQSVVDLAKTPSFEYRSEDEMFRVEIKPRLIELPSNRART